MVTLAPGIDACLESTTRPVMREVLVCATAVMLAAAIKVNTIVCSTVRRSMERPPFCFETGRKTIDAKLELVCLAAVYARAIFRQGFLCAEGERDISHSYQTDKNI